MKEDAHVFESNRTRRCIFSGHFPTFWFSNSANYIQDRRYYHSNAIIYVR